jgi:hypothetical protein
MGWGVRITPRPRFTPGYVSRFPLDRRLGGPPSWFGHWGYRKNPMPLPDIKPRSSSLHSDTILTEITQILYEMDGACKMHGMLEVRIKFWRGILKERNRSKDGDVYWRTKLEQIIRNQCVWVWTGFTWFRMWVCDRLPHEHSNEPSGSVKARASLTSWTTISFSGKTCFMHLVSCCLCRWGDTLFLNCGHKWTHYSSLRWHSEPRWNDIDSEKPKTLEKNRSQCHFVHHKSNADWLGS